MSHRRACLIALLCCALTLLSACTSGGARKPGPSGLSSQQALNSVQVTGDFARHVDVTFPTPLTVTQDSAETLIQGTGPVLTENGPALLKYETLNADTGEVVDNTFGSKTTLVGVTEETLGKAIHDGVVGKPSGSRILILAASTDAASHAVVAVVDLLPLSAQGTALAPQPGLPAVTTDDDGTPTIEVPTTQPPGALEKELLIQGSGAPVQAGSDVMLQYVSTSWNSREVVDSTWANDGIPLKTNVSDVIEGWKRALPGVPVGSRLLVISPPQLANGDSTLISVIDVLAADPASASTSPSPSN